PAAADRAPLRIRAAARREARLPRAAVRAVPARSVVPPRRSGAGGAPFMARRFGVDLKIAPLDQCRGRAAKTEQERKATLAANATRRRRRRESREARLAG